MDTIQLTDFAFSQIKKVVSYAVFARSPSILSLKE